MQAGIDEAGRGPLLGPLVVAGVRVEDPAVLAQLGCRDSKMLSPAKREAIDRNLRADPAIRIEVRSIAPEILDQERQRLTLNDIEAARFREIAEAFSPDLDLLYLDAADVDARRFGRAVARGLGRRTKVVSEHKADDSYPVVGAASIVAKVARDAAVAALARRLERKLEMPLGSGYAHDEDTRLFLKAWVERFGDVPEGTRRSWAPVKELLAPKPVSLDAFVEAKPLGLPGLSPSPAPLAD
jgi:ribonuclease HII